MKPRKLLHVVLVIVGGTVSFSMTSMAATVAEFTQNAFAAAQHQGKPIIVHITASWCPTCAAQRPIIAHLESEPEFADLLVFKVDFDTQKDVVRQMRARMQSTIVAFRGDKEVGRSVGDTKSDSIRALLDQAVR